MNYNNKGNAMKKEFIKLMEENIAVSLWLHRRVQNNPNSFGYSNQQLRIVVHIYMLGRMMLKDIARNTDMSPSNLSPILKLLEEDGLVNREIDADDRRNTWYSMTSAGSKIARLALDELGERIDAVFSGMTKKDEIRLTEALRTINEVFETIKTTYEKQSK